MATTPDLLYVALFAIAGPLIDHAFVWPAHRRLLQTDPITARKRLWALTIGSQWLLVGLGAAIWIAHGRSLAPLGLALPEGWRLWSACALVMLFAAYQGWAIAVLARSSLQREALRHQFESVAAMLPHTRPELPWFAGVSLTAGCCEEFMYRGYFIVVVAPWTGWWGAAALSLPFFALAHAYQGSQGLLRTTAAGTTFTLMVAAFESLWPAMALHALVDLGSGVMAWLVLREAQPRDPEQRNAA